MRHVSYGVVSVLYLEGAAGGAEAWPQMDPGVVRGAHTPYSVGPPPNFVVCVCVIKYRGELPEHPVSGREWNCLNARLKTGVPSLGSGPGRGHGHGQSH